ncbi:SIR2 family protein [Bacillus thuringiensis]|uniref:SIR2 family protein n=1 Tax=Bacillus thuringiensis TaxID=1428 RepID=UPI000BED80B8|nr:SIR2 family protein [Bacillus thuringiensis]PEE68082.1 hypothetical protein COM73_25700 [Bacillus thuringiensis]
MNKDIREFLETYTTALEESTAALFAGAGLSKPAGYVDWKELLEDVAKDIELDVTKETDLVEVAQYHVNEYKGRNKINQILVQEFNRDAKPTENNRILAELPIKTFWTTNYDRLIEMSLESAYKRCDVKITKENFATTLPNWDAILYKMHGDISQPHDAVLTKDDYEGYHVKRNIFTTALQGDLVSKTFLFIGFSFDDPNLEYVLSRIRILLGENQRQHYCFMREVHRDGYETEEEFLYAKIKQQLKINDLGRFKIKVLLVKEYSEITDTLKQLKSKVKRKNIFISGSAAEYGEWGEARAFEFASQLSKQIIKQGYNIFTGFGLGIGSCVLAGALDEIYINKYKRVEDRLISRPFPQHTSDPEERKKLWTIHRNEMIENVGYSIFIFGNKIKNGQVVIADGMEEEFDISIKKGVVPIPIGATGYTAEALWKKIMDEFDKYISDTNLESHYQVIGDQTKTNSEIIQSVLAIIKHLNKRK